MINPFIMTGWCSVHSYRLFPAHVKCCYIIGFPIIGGSFSMRLFFFMHLSVTFRYEM